eukprot:jgi/Botrbrau1/19717/Bobra.0003s0077.1
MVGTVYLVYFGTRDGVGCLPRYVWHEASYRFDALNSGFCIQGWELKYTWRATAVCLTSTWDVGLKYRSDLGALGYGLLGTLGWISFYVLYVYLMCTVATTGSYLSLSDTPNLGVYVLSNGLSQVATTGSYLSLSDAPNLNVYALSNSIHQADWAQANTSNLSFILNKPANLSQFSNDSGFVVQGSSPAFENLNVSSNLSLSNGVLQTNVSPLFNGSFWSISDNPIEKPSALSEALKIGGYVFDAGQVLWDGAQQAQLMFNQGQMADQMAAQTAADVAERLNDPENELTINWSSIFQKPIANQGISQDIGIAGGIFMDGSIYLDGGASVGLDGGVSWGSADRSKKILDVGAERINLLTANTNSLLCNIGTISALTSGDINADNIYCVANLVSLGKLVGNAGAFNSVLSNLGTVSTLTTSDSFCGNIYVTGNLKTSGNVSMTTANVTSLVGQTATLTGNLVVPSANIASLQTGNVVFSNTSYHSNTTLIAPSVQTANLYVSNVSYLSNAALVAPSIVSNAVNVGNSLANNYIVMSNGSLSIGNTSSSTFGFCSISSAGIVSNSISVSDDAYVINAQGLFQKVPAGNAYMSYPNLSPYAQLSQLSQVSTSSLTTIAGTTLQVAGNVSGNYLFGNASQVTGLTNSQLPSSISVPGAIVSNTSISTAGNVTASYLFGNASQLTGLPTNTFTGVLNNNQLPSAINVPGTLVSGTLPAGNLTTPVPALQSNTSVYTQGFLIGDGGYVSNIRATSISSSLTNAQLPSTISVPVNTSGNVSANFILGNIQNASAIQNSQLPSNPSFGGTVSAAAFTTSGAVLTTSNFIGNISLCNGLTNGQLPSSISVPGNINSNASITATGNISTPLFINAGYFFGNGSQLTGLTNNQLPSNISCSYLTVNTSLVSTDTVTGNIGSFPGWCQANTYWLASTQAWNASGPTTSTYMVSGNLGPSTYFGGTTTSSMPIILANCSLYSWGFIFADGGMLSNIRGQNIATQINNNRLPTTVNIGGTLRANGATVLTSTLGVNGNTSPSSSYPLSVQGGAYLQGNLAFHGGAYFDSYNGLSGNGISIVWGGTNTSALVFQSDTNVVAYSKTGAAVWAMGAINSDRKFKKNIEDMGSVTDALRRIKARRFKYNDDVLDRDQVGFVVDEVKDLIPEAIQEITNPITGTKNNLLRYEKLSPYLVQAFKELDERVSALEKNAKK